jgi:outer membrane lipoprotein-sorting protein
MNKDLSKITTFIILFLITNLSGGDAEEKLLRSLQNKFEEINDLTVDIIQRSGGNEVLSGKLSYKKESSGSEKFLFEMKNNFIVSDGSVIWNYNKSKNKVIINSVDETDPSFFSFKKMIYDYPAECNLASERKGSSDILIFVPKDDSELNFNKVALWINQDNLIDKIVLESAVSKNIEIIFSGYRIDQNLADSKFNFTPPEGSTIIDLR